MNGAFRPKGGNGVHGLCDDAGDVGCADRGVLGQGAGLNAVVEVWQGWFTGSLRASAHTGVAIRFPWQMAVIFQCISGAAGVMEDCYPNFVTLESAGADRGVIRELRRGRTCEFPKNPENIKIPIDKRSPGAIIQS